MLLIHTNEPMVSTDIRLRVTLFGTFRLTLAGGEEVEITGKRARAVLAILCLTPGVAVERALLCELLWHGRFQAQARASLRQTLLGLKKQLAPLQLDFFEITRESVAVNQAMVCSDLAELESVLAGGLQSQASEMLVQIGGKALLGRLDFGKPFEQWLAARRAQVEQRLKHAVEAALADLQRCGEEQEHARLLDAWGLRLPAAAVSVDETRTRIGILPFQASVPGQRRTPASKSAFDLYLQGRALTMRAIGDGVLARAVELLEAALAIDPEFADGWTALAEARACMAVYTPCLDRLEQSRRMAECARKAIELDPGQGHARALLGIHRWTENDPVGALDLAHEAYRLEPDNPDVVLRLGSFLLYIGHTREALPYIEAAIDLDPVNGRSFAILCVARLNLGHIDAAIAAGQRMVDLGLPSMWLAVATAASGNHDLAVEQYRQTRLLMNTVIFPPAGTKALSGPALKAYWQVAAKGVCSGGAVHRAVYCTLLDYLHTTLPDGGDTSIVAPAIWMGYAKMVFKTLGTQITPANMYCLMSIWADIEPIRQIRLDREFMPFAERIGMLAAWEKYGWPDLLPAPNSRTSTS